MSRAAGIERAHVDHGLGAVFTDVNGDGRPDLYVANDLDPNRLYVNVPGGKLGFHFVEQGRALGVADPSAGMGIAAQDYSGDGRPDVFVTNYRGQGHAAFRSTTRSPFADAHDVFGPALGATGAGWGASWVDLANNGREDLVLANGAIPVVHLDKDAAPIQVLENLGAGRFADASGAVGLASGPRVNGRGLAAADYDNDGRVDVAINSIGGKLILLHNTGRVRTLARGEPCEVRARRGRHSRAPGRPPPRPPGPGGKQLSVVRGSSRPLRPRQSDEGESAYRPLAERQSHATDDRRSRSDPQHRQIATRARRGFAAPARANRRSRKPTTAAELARARSAPAKVSSREIEDFARTGAQRPARTCSRRPTVSSVTASRRMTPVTM